MKRQRVAVIGSGISGLSIAWLLRDRADVQIFEKNSHYGGHSNTVMVNEGDRQISVDTGFIVLNDRNYPNLLALFGHLDVPIFDTVMSFAVSEQRGRYEYGGAGFSALFAQKRNLLSPRHHRMLLDIVRFNRAARACLKGEERRSIGEFLNDNNFSSDLVNRYLLPMAAAIWSCPVSQMRLFPAASLCRFFENHGLLDLKNRPQWHSVAGGSRVYVQRMLDQIGRQNCHRQAAVSRVSKDATGWRIYAEGIEPQQFDQVVFACHADQSLGLLDAPAPPIPSVLSAFRYQKNIAWLHSDDQLMPKRRAVWSAWNYLTERDGRENADVSVTYWMNLLQKLPSQKNYFVTLNPLQEPRSEKTHCSIEYEHPVFDAAAVQQQQNIAAIQGQDGLWFCGSYCANGFHEDGLKSAVVVFNGMGHTAPWQENSHNVPIAA